MSLSELSQLFFWLQSRSQALIQLFIHFWWFINLSGLTEFTGREVRQQRINGRRKITKLTRSVITRWSKTPNCSGRDRIKLCLYTDNVSQGAESFVPNTPGQISKYLVCVRMIGLSSTVSLQGDVLSLCMLTQCLRTLIVLN